jgi:type IV pilus assembly protein PilC
MFLSPRLGTKQLAELSHRLAVELEAGIDVRRIWQREAENARGSRHGQFAAIRDAVARGDSLAESLARTGRFLPRTFLEMVHVGEQTGKLAEVFHSLSRYYRHRVALRRAMFIAMTWPMIQLVITLFVVGVLIWVAGVIGQRGTEVDFLGFGLVGTSGLIVYLNILVGLAVAGMLLTALARRDILPVDRMKTALMHVPPVGASLKKLALARIAWAMHLVLNVEMDMRRAIPMILQAAGNDYFGRHAEDIVGDVVAGQPLHVAFRRTGAFPMEFVEALQVGDESGRTVEAMGRLSQRYEEEARDALSVLATVAGFLVWALVAALIILLIFRLFGFYVGTIRDAAGM